MSRNEMFVAFATILVKEVRRFFRIWPQTLVPPAITIALYYVIFGNLIGSRIGPMSGFDYMQFVVPGLIMMAVITNSYANVVSSFFGAKYQHSIEELLVSPTPEWIILLGYTMGGMARGICVGFIVTLLSLAFTRLHVAHAGLTMLVVLLTSMLFSMAGLVNAVYANSFDDISIIPTFVLTPLTYLGGVFYSIDLLPPFWRALSQTNPILHMVNAFRHGVLGVSDVNVGFALTMIALFIVVLWAYSLQLLKSGKRLRQ
ncbi:MAG: ABC transporter permease [Pseudomonadales bacterium]|jgi:ABC-2 type transport system permease protein|nr:ABC transporter permease [Pseudomonadales bacterium]MCP5337480.1 ABC transporter permease [Pseudomonadales bacterium]